MLLLLVMAIKFSIFAQKIKGNQRDLILFFLMKTDNG